MKFVLLMFMSWVVLLSSTCVRSHPSSEVRVTSQFSDGRHVTFACLSYKHFGPDELLALSSPIQPYGVAWTNHHFNGETLQKCHMVWRRKDGGAGGEVRSAFEAFTGSHDHRDATDGATLEVKYIWLLNENGLSRYSFQSGVFVAVKPIGLIQYIEVQVVNLLRNEAISIVCTSEERSGHKELVALESYSRKDGGRVEWSIKDFNKETTQVCRVETGDQNFKGLVFEAFVGSWDHQYVSRLDPIDGRRRRYSWILRKPGLYRHQYGIGTDVLVQSWP